jgi:hypothetical protein
VPTPDCALRPSDCADIDVLNTLDGFNLQPRLVIPFSGASDAATVDSTTVYLASLGDTLGGGGKTVGINQVVWDPVTNTPPAFRALVGLALAFPSPGLLAFRRKPHMDVRGASFQAKARPAASASRGSPNG